MQCACPECGVLMAHLPKGLESGCKCAYCGHQCRDCMGREDFRVLNKEELRSLEQHLGAPGE